MEMIDFFKLVAEGDRAAGGSTTKISPGENGIIVWVSLDGNVKLDFISYQAMGTPGLLLESINHMQRHLKEGT